MTNQPAPPLFPREAVNDLLEARDSYRRGIVTILKVMGFDAATPVVVEKRQVVITLPHDNAVHLPLVEWEAIKGMLDE